MSEFDRCIPCVFRAWPSSQKGLCAPLCPSSANPQPQQPRLPPTSEICLSRGLAGVSLLCGWFFPRVRFTPLPCVRAASFSLLSNGHVSLSPSWAHVCPLHSVTQSSKCLVETCFRFEGSILLCCLDSVCLQVRKRIEKLCVSDHRGCDCHQLQ